MNPQDHALPHSNGSIYLTDGGMETTLIFQHGYELPYFAAFDLLKDAAGRKTLKSYYEIYAALAVQSRAGFILESPTWRANSDWASKLGYDREQLAKVNHDAIDLMNEIRDEYSVPTSPFLVSGCVGPRGDGYQVTDSMTAADSKSYHLPQITAFSECRVDLINAMTLTYPDEATGIVHAAQSVGIPIVISFTTETDGHLPNGDSLQSAIEKVDSATNNGPVYYMINCAHPDHFTQALQENAHWVKRIHGVRANASRKSHSELDEAEELDSGNPIELAQMYLELRRQFPHFNVLGGCCGTDHRHVDHICQSCIH